MSPDEVNTGVKVSSLMLLKVGICVGSVDYSIDSEAYSIDSVD